MFEKLAMLLLLLGFQVSSLYLASFDHHICTLLAKRMHEFTWIFCCFLSRVWYDFVCHYGFGNTVLVWHSYRQYTQATQIPTRTTSYSWFVTRLAIFSIGSHSSLMIYIVFVCMFAFIISHHYPS